MNRPLIKKLLEKLETKDEDLHHAEGMIILLYKCNIQQFFTFVDHRDVVYLDLLVRLLYPRGLGKDVTFIKKFEVSVVKVAKCKLGEYRVSLIITQWKIKQNIP